MKRIYIYSLLTLAAAAFSFSCVKTTVEEPVKEGQTVTVTCAFPEPDTKVAINDADGKTSWAVGDEILIHGKATEENVTVTLTKDNISSDGKKASFSVTLPATPYLDDDITNPNGYYAAYPASAYIENSSGRGYHYNTFDETNLPLMSASYDASAKTFTFHNLCGIISFTVTGTYDSYIFTGNESETVGYDKYAVKTIYGQTPNYKHSSTSGAKSSITGTIASSGATLICLPNGASFSKGFKLVLLSGGNPVKQMVYTGDVTVERNQYRPMGDITSKLTDYVPETGPSTENYNDSAIAIGSASALDATENANCYIVTAAGSYKFKAVQGNDATAVLTTIASVGILWETQNTSDEITENTVISAVDYDYHSGTTPYIVFSTPSTLANGNAVIFAKDDHNDIIWSWHIWIPTDAVSNADYSAFIGGNMMNMNLGALKEVPTTGSASIESLGLLYQWGRKDPFVGAAEWKAYPAKAAVAGTARSTSKNQQSIEKSIQNPTIYYFTGSDDTNWCTSTEPTWDNTTAKTKYDPCPPGYKVPMNTGTLWTDTAEDKWTFDQTNHIFTHTTSTVKLPTAGWIESYGGSLCGAGINEGSSTPNRDAIFFWSAKSHDDNRAECAHIRLDKSPKYYKTYRGKANAGSVRCIAE